MSKKKRKHKKAKTKVEEIALPKPVGWIFWLIVFLVLFGPMTYGGYLLSEEDRRGTLLPWIVGFSGAAIMAGIISAGLNSIIEFRSKRILKKHGKSKG